MNESFTQEFASFVRDNLRPAVDMVNTRKRSVLFVSLLAAGGLFVIFAAVVYFLMAPYANMMREHDIISWPILLLVPLSVGMVAFSLVYILGLRKVVVEFRNVLADRLGEFVDGGLSHTSNRILPGDQIRDSLLFLHEDSAKSGSDLYRGRVGKSVVEIVPLQVSGKNEGQEKIRHGVFLSAKLEKPAATPYLVFPSDSQVSRSDLEEQLKKSGNAPAGGLVRLDTDGRQILTASENGWTWPGGISPKTVRILDEVRQRTGTRLSLSCLGDRLALALISDRKRLDFPRLFDEMDFLRCQEFAGDAKLLTDITKEIGG